MILVRFYSTNILLVLRHFTVHCKMTLKKSGRAGCWRSSKHYRQTKDKRAQDQNVMDRIARTALTVI